MDRESFEKTAVKVHDDTGPCTRALNDYYVRSDGAPFFDHMFFHTDRFYLKYTQRIWRDQLWRPVESPIVREFREGDMELASQCLYGFQALCDQEQLSTRNPISFFKSLDSYWETPRSDFHTRAALFLFATTDRGFLFDSAIQNSIPSIFITRAFIDQVRASDNILKSSVLMDIRFEPPLGERYEKMQEQVRYFHLMLPNRITYCNRWENFTLPLVRKMQHRNMCYYQNCDSNFSLDDTLLHQLVDAAMDCFIWYMLSRKWLSPTDRDNIDKKAQDLQNSNDFRDIMTEIVKAICDKHYVNGFPFFYIEYLPNPIQKSKALKATKTKRYLM